DVEPGSRELDGQRQAHVAQAHNAHVGSLRGNLLLKIFEITHLLSVPFQKNSPLPISSAGPAKKIASPSQRNASGPAGVKTCTGAVTRPRARAAAAAPVDPVPELMVSPAPRSKKRTSSVWALTTRTKETLVRF